jgi:GAF domain-containing protein
LAAVRRYDVLDTPPDGAFDRITALAARFFDVPISIISIVDHDRIWFKSHHGLDATEIGRDPGLCASAICHVEPWLVNDAQVDVRTIDNPLVAGELGLRFYLGIPLTTSDGFNLGTLNVIDVKPREVTDAQIATLADLAAVVVDELELRLNVRKTLEERRRRALELNDEVVQGLAVAHLALQTGGEQQAREAIATTLGAVQDIVAELLETAGDRGRLRPGDLVRATHASISPSSRP